MKDIALWANDMLRGVCGWLCEFLYWIISWLYELFFNLSKVELLTSDNIKPIYQRVTMILTIVMVFYVTFEAVKYVIQPETFTDKEKGGDKLVIKMVLVVVLIAFVPTIFGLAYDFQNTVFDNQLFSKVILGKQNIDSEKFGRVFSANILGMFYYADEENWSKEELENQNNCDKVPCKNLVNMNLNSLVEYGELPLMQVGLTSKGTKQYAGAGGDIKMYYIHFNGIFAVAVGLFIAWMMINYCIEVGVRVAQMAFLQIMSPIAIIGYLSPKKDGMFQKWLKQCTTTYLDLFLRTGIIYFVLLLCQILSDAYNSGTLVNNITNDSPTMKMFIYIALVIGLLHFAKKAPKMLEELFPKMGSASGNFGVKGAPEVVRGTGAVIGAAAAGAKGLIGATVNQAKRNWRNFKTGKMQDDKNNLEKSKQNFKTAKQRYKNSLFDSTMSKKEKDEARQQYRDAKIEKESAKAARQNSRFRLASAAGAAGAVGGVVRGAVNGGQATELKSIGKQVTQGLKKESEALARTEKWYNEGGGSNFDRVVTSVEKSFGISTEADRRAEEIKYEEAQIKANETLIAAESDVKSKVDTAKGRSGSKLEALEQKTKVAKDTVLEYKDINGNTVSEKVCDKDETTSSIYERYRRDANDKKIKAEELTKAAEEVKRDKTATPAQKDAADKAAQKAQIEASNAERKRDQMKKALEEHAITLILQGKDTTDGTLVSQVEDTKKSIELSKRNRTTIERIRVKLAGNASALNAYLTGNITTYKQLDDIQTALINIANDRTRENADRKETKRKLETSDANTAAKADNSAAGK